MNETIPENVIAEAEAVLRSLDPSTAWAMATLLVAARQSGVAEGQRAAVAAFAGV